MLLVPELVVVMFTTEYGSQTEPIIKVSTLSNIHLVHRQSVPVAGKFLPSVV